MTLSRPPAMPPPQAPPPSDIAGYEHLVSITPDGVCTLSIRVDGVHCAHCIQKIESSLMQHPAMQAARINFSTGRLALTWRGAAALANQFVRMVSELGYRVTPQGPAGDAQTSDKTARHLLLCLGVAGFAMANIMLLSIGLWSSDATTMGAGTRALLHWISGAIALPAIAFAGRPFFTSAFNALRHGRTNMDVPISLAFILTSVMSVYEAATHGAHVYFDSAVMLMFFLLVGRYLDYRARHAARRAASDLLQTLTGFATVLVDGVATRLPIRDIRPGMQVLVAVGEIFPVDGTIINGMTQVDTSLVTGETLPRPAGSGDVVYAGTLNVQAPVTVSAAKVAENTLLSDIVRLMEKAEQAQASYVRLADRVARAYTPVVHVLALLAFFLWWGVWGAMWQDALLISVTVLIITCPCALALAVPVVQVLAVSLLMRRGVLVKTGDALERLAKVDTVLCDKTGTLTRGQPTLIGTYDPLVLQQAASLAAQSAHPLARAIVAANTAPLLPVLEAEDITGQGVSGYVCDVRIRLGNAAFCDVQDVQGNDGYSSSWLKVGDTAPVCLRFTDVVRDDAGQVIADLQRAGLSVTLLSGDRQSVADAVARQVGIHTVLAAQNPVDKYAVLQGLKAQGRCVLMVGDGLNDAPVLTGADVSMAPGTAIDMAQNAADIVFMGEKLAPVTLTLRVARLAQHLVRQNFALAMLYNLIAVPLAFAGYVTPLVAALAMSGSSLVVIANAFRLRRVR